MEFAIGQRVLVTHTGDVGNIHSISYEADGFNVKPIYTVISWKEDKLYYERIVTTGDCLELQNELPFDGNSCDNSAFTKWLEERKNEQ